MGGLGCERPCGSGNSGKHPEGAEFCRDRRTEWTASWQVGSGFLGPAPGRPNQPRWLSVLGQRPQVRSRRLPSDSVQDIRSGRWSIKISTFVPRWWLAWWQRSLASSWEPLRQPREKRDSKSGPHLRRGEHARGHWVHHNWTDRSPGRRGDQAPARHQGVSTEVTLHDEGQIPHARALEIVWVDGRHWSCSLDHGFGFLSTVGRVDYRFEDSRQQQAIELAAASFDVETTKEGIAYVSGVE